LIKITYVTELAVSGNNIVFTLPESIAPHHIQKLRPSLPTVVPTIAVDTKSANTASQQDFLSIELAVEMATPIKAIVCLRHPILIKTTATKATVQLNKEKFKGASLESSFILAIELEDPHSPRMWIEKDQSGHHALMVNSLHVFQ